MGFLTDYEEDAVVYDGKRYTLDLAYDSVLNVKRMYQDSKLEEVTKLEAALEILLDPPGQASRLSLKSAGELLEIIFEEKIIEKPRNVVPSSPVRLVDFELDGEYIYASFLQDYGIDLIEQQGKMGWKKFLALFDGLSEKTKMREVMKIRGMELPRPNRFNQKEIQRLQELKAYYALPVRGNGGKEGLDRLWGVLERMAKG